MDEDVAYDEWREMCVNRLDDELRMLVRRFVEDKHSYYRDNPLRVWEHMKSKVDFEVQLGKGSCKGG